ncbi:electron transport complex subunit RsxG [Methylicorpusculum oleiharenae]|uniref:electron transport complex subunit RsxG n=1 Tax=Methylicorpusculum oleiharenae TaxID=1338687 RepID=UPI001357A84D|nr:electron transport complex subunit RsxG [Methylicorpusculum oleiharenae]MCD2452209.1 electron transport complex subunit RsxG [Methylicorpusculum oleiharenae]
MNLKQLKARVSYQTILLAAYALIASALLGVADLNTRDVIKLRQEEDLKASLVQVVPAELFDNDLVKDAVPVPADSELGTAETLVYLARKQGEITAAAFQLTAPDGYSGNIKMIMGLNRNGEVLGVRVIAHAETPGLGDKIEVSKSDWILNFNGRSIHNLTVKEWAVKKDGGIFDQFSGATITPRAVVNTIYKGLLFFDKHKSELFN